MNQQLEKIRKILIRPFYHIIPVSTENTLMLNSSQELAPINIYPMLLTECQSLVKFRVTAGGLHS